MPSERSMLMLMIESLAEKLAVKIKKTNEQDTVSIAVMKYALIIVINFFNSLYFSSHNWHNFR